MKLLQPLIHRYLTPPGGPTTVALGLGIALRLYIVSGLKFPLNDGGFWYAYANAIGEAGFALPHTIRFNGEDVLASYPPLAAYLLAALERGLGVGLIPLLIWVPFFISIASLVVFLVFALRFLGRSTAAYVSMFAFALLPLSYRGFLMGGGVARGLGLLFLMLSWLCLKRGCDDDSRRDLFLGGLCAGLSALSHPVAGLLAATGGAVLLVREGRLLRAAPVVILGGALVVCPWLFWMVNRYGLSPYLTAFHSGGQAITGTALAALSLDTYGHLRTLNAVVMVGILASLASRWSVGFQVFVLMLLIMPLRIPHDFGCIPLALLAGEGGTVIWTALNSAAMVRSTALRMGALLMLFISVVESGGYAKTAIGHTLVLEEVQEIQKLDSLFPEPRKIMVLSQFFVNGGDALGEWIGTFSKHQAVLTHQLREWTGDFFSVIRQRMKVEGCCATPTSACVERVLSIAQSMGTDMLMYTHRKSCRGLELEMLASGRCKAIFSDAVPMMRCS